MAKKMELRTIRIEPGTYLGVCMDKPYMLQKSGKFWWHVYSLDLKVTLRRSSIKKRPQASIRQPKYLGRRRSYKAAKQYVVNLAAKKVMQTLAQEASGEMPF